MEFHDRKLDALEDIIEAANEKPLLVAYWFRHDLARIKNRFSMSGRSRQAATLLTGMRERFL
jgi:hypothetical protein